MVRYVPGSDEERAFLAAYREKRYPRPCVTVDVVAFSLRDADLQVLLIQRRGYPYRDAWALPGGFVEVGDTFDDQGEDLDAAAARELAEETGLVTETVALEQLFTVGTPLRDPRTRIISIVYLALVPPSQARGVRAGDDAAAARWTSTMELATVALAFDHGEILRRALAHLGRTLERDALARSLLGEAFTPATLEAVAQGAQGESFDAARFRRSFRRLVADGLVVRLAGGGRGHYRYA